MVVVCDSLGESRRKDQRSDFSTWRSPFKREWRRPLVVKKFMCADIGMNRGFEARASTVEQLMSRIADHAKMLRSPLEKKLAERLHEIKYSRHDWNFEGKAPPSLKDVLIEVYVAYPPTKSCKEIIETVQSAMSNLKDKVELRIWMRGKGLDGSGSPPDVPMSLALMEAVKRSIVPAVIINGQLAFSEDVPSAEGVENKILQALGR